MFGLSYLVSSVCLLCSQWKSNQLDKQKYPKKQLHTLFYLIWMAKVRKKTFS
jgi:hypothetical protein